MTTPRTEPFNLDAPIRSDARAVVELAEFVRKLAADDRVPFVIQAQALALILRLQK